MIDNKIYKPISVLNNVIECGNLSPGLFSSKTDEWATPQDFFDELDGKFHFTLDVCATPSNAKCKLYFTKEQDGLT